MIDLKAIVVDAAIFGGCVEDEGCTVIDVDGNICI